MSVWSEKRSPFVKALVLSLSLHCVFVAILVLSAGERLKREEIGEIITVYIGADDRGGLVGVPRGHEASGRSNRGPRQTILPQTPPSQPAAPTYPKTSVKEAGAARGGAGDTVAIAPSLSRSPTTSAPAGTHSGDDPGGAAGLQGGVSRMGAPTSLGEAEDPGRIGEGAIAGGRNASGGGWGSEAGGDGSGAGQAEGNNSHVAAQFAYIRGLILKNLAYPPEARRVGLRGRVTVDFVILENGLARSIRIIESSGYDVLDRSVVETIRRCQPFPRPPARAELTIPIVFKLK